MLILYCIVRLQLVGINCVHLYYITVVNSLLLLNRRRLVVNVAVVVESGCFTVVGSTHTVAHVLHRSKTRQICCGEYNINITCKEEGVGIQVSSTPFRHEPLQSVSSPTFLEITLSKFV